MSPHISREGTLSLPVAVLLGAIVIGGSIIYAGSRPAAPVAGIAVQAPSAQAVAANPAQPSGQVAADVKAVKVSGEEVVGASSAPVVVAYWYDYQCPFCKQNEVNSMPQLMADYVNNGKIRIVFKDMQFLGTDSTALGIASRAVWEVAPAKWYAWHSAIFQNQGRENSGWATKDKIQSITAGVLGSADTARAMSLMTTKASAYQALMDADRAEAAKFGIRSTPSMVIGTSVITGARPYSDIKAAIDLALKK
jgi:protein-disulfide isomerase